RLEFRALGMAAAGTDQEYALGDGDINAKPLFLFPPEAIAETIYGNARPARNFGGNIPQFAESLSAGDTLVVTRSAGMRDRLNEIFKEY
ncbi:hypothetical protein OFC37_31170, partial [Escherichia coli]|nr:hypothetical protein [Escherichia coli]